MAAYANYKKVGILANKLEDEEIKQIVNKLKKYGIEKCSRTVNDESTMLLVDNIKELGNLNYDNCILFLLPGIHYWDNTIFMFKKLKIVGFTFYEKYETIIKIKNWNYFNCDNLKIKSLKIDIETEENASYHFGSTYGAIIFRNNCNLILKDNEITNVNTMVNTVCIEKLNNVKIKQSKFEGGILEISGNHTLKIFDSIFMNLQLCLGNGAGNVISNYFDSKTNFILWDNHMSFIKNVFNMAPNFPFYIANSSDCCFVQNKFKSDVGNIFKVKSHSHLILAVNNFTTYKINTIFARVSGDSSVISNQCYIEEDGKKINIDVDTLMIEELK